VKYTVEQETQMLDAYTKAETTEQRAQVVIDLAITLSKPTRSIIAKLSKMGIYISKAKISKVTGNKPETKEQLVRRVEKRFGAAPEDYMGLEKAPKMVILDLLNKNPILL